MKHLLIISLLCGLSQIACSPKNLIEPAKTASSICHQDSNILWTCPIVTDTTECILAYTAIIGQQVVYAQMKEGYEHSIVARDLKTGRVNWTWGDSHIASGHMISDLKVSENKIVVQSWQDLFVLDAVSGKTIWHTDVRQQEDCAFPRISIIGNNIYYTTNDCSPKRLFCTLWRTPITHFKPQLVYRLNANDPIMGDSGWIYSIETAALWKKNTRDSILIFQTRAHKKGAGGNKSDLLAVDLRKHHLLWKIDSITQEGWSSVNPPIIEGDFIYHTGHFSIQKVNALTGTIEWSHKFTEAGEQFAFTGITLSNDGKIYTYPGAQYLYALDKNSGRQVWKTKLSCCGMTGNIIYADKKLYLVGPPYRYTIDATTGIVIKKDKSGMKKNNYSTEFVQFAHSVNLPDKKGILSFDSHYLIASRY